MTPLELAQLCQRSYDGGVEFTNVRDLAFGVIDCGDATVVVFRGSDNALNWLRDCSAVPERTRSGHYAHEGFVGAMDDLRDAVAARLPVGGKPIIYTGHSLGGAIAVLFAQEAGERAVTFGCPRVWWAPSATPSIDHVRVICDDDPVPMVPRIFFKHDLTEQVIVLNDHDGELVNPEDHFVDHYVDRLTKGAS